MGDLQDFKKGKSWEPYRSICNLNSPTVWWINNIILYDYDWVHKSCQDFISEEEQWVKTCYESSVPPAVHLVVLRVKSPDTKLKKQKAEHVSLESWDYCDPNYAFCKHFKIQSTQQVQSVSLSDHQQLNKLQQNWRNLHKKPPDSPLIHKISTKIVLLHCKGSRLSYSV